MPDWPGKDRLIELVRKYALEVAPEGEFFTLKSGARSPYYLDCRNLNLMPDGLQQVVMAISRLSSNMKFDAFGGPSIGADPIIGGLTYYNALSPKSRKGFLIRPQAKDHGKSGRIVGPLKPGDRCLLIEDVVTSGGSSMDAIDVIQDFGATVVHVFSVVDRLLGGAETFSGRGIPYTPLLTIRDFGLEPA